MTQCCLICESTAVLSKKAANTVMMLMGTIERMLRAASQIRTRRPAISLKNRQESHLLQLLELFGQGVSEAESEGSAMTAFANDVHKYQFSHCDFFCLRCGARFDKNSSAKPHDL